MDFVSVAFIYHVDCDQDLFKMMRLTDSKRIQVVEIKSFG
jgi:hypothetical protein